MFWGENTESPATIPDADDRIYSLTSNIDHACAGRCSCATLDSCVQEPATYLLLSPNNKIPMSGIPMPTEITTHGLRYILHIMSSHELHSLLP